MSPGLWNRAVESLGSRLAPVPDSQGNPVKDSQGNIELEAQVDFGPLLAVVGVFSAGWWWAGAWWISAAIN